MKARLPSIPAVPAIAVGLVVVASLALGLLQLRAASAQNTVALSAQPRGVTVALATDEPYRSSRRYVGTLAPWLSARIGPQVVSAFVDTVLVRPGAIVKRGEVLATLDCRKSSGQSRTAALQARALEARQAALASESARLGTLKEGGFVSENELERKTAEARAEAVQVLALRSQLSQRAFEASDCVLRAPFDGEISERKIDPGVFAKPGDALLGLVDRSTIRVLVEVPEADYDAVAVGTPTRVKPFAFGKAVEAVISRRGPSADRSTRTLHVEIDLPKAEQSLPVGTSAEITLDAGAPIPATRIPLIAAKVRGSKATIFVVEAGVAKSRTLDVVGERAGALYVSRELAPGARVVVEGRSLLADNDAVVAKELPASPGASK